MSADMEDHEQIIQLLLFLLHCYGIYPFTQDYSAIRTKWLLVYSYTAYTGMIMGNLCLIAFSQDIVSSISGLSVIIGTSYFFLAQFWSVHKRQHLQQLLVAFGSQQQQWLAFVQKLKIPKKISHQRMLCIHKWIAMYNIYCFAVVMAFPICAVWLLGISMGEPSSLLFTSWYPWDVREARWYIVTYVIQIFSGVLVQLILYTTTGFNWIVLCVFRNDFYELKAAVGSLRHAQSAQNVASDLECCIRRHQALTSSFNEYKSWFDVLYASELAYYTLEFLFLGSMAFSNSHDIIYQARSTLLLLNITMLLYIHCWIGESFYSLNGLLSEELYSLPWYESNFIAAKKNICIFIGQTQYPLCLTAFKIFQASLQVFFRILRSSYSYLSLLLATLK